MHGKIPVRKLQLQYLRNEVMVPWTKEEGVGSMERSMWI